MTLSKFIINDIKSLKETTTVTELKAVFNQLTYSHIPIVDKAKTYLGCFSETDVHCFDSDKKIDEYNYALEHFFVKEQTNWLDVLEAFTQNNANIIPVLSTQNKYLGYYELNDIIGIFSNTPFFNEVGSILIVEKNIDDYSLSEICQIVESNNGKLLGAFISKMENDTTQITLKIGNTPLNAIVQTFRRYDYQIVSEFEEDTYLENLKERSAYLNKFMNI